MRNRLFLWFASLILWTAGCGVPARYPAVELQAYNTLTNEPIADVTVTRWETLSDGPDAGKSFPTLTGKTGKHGLIGAVQTHWPPTLVFTKDGFLPAEVRVESEASVIASPSAGSRTDSPRWDFFSQLFLPRLQFTAYGVPNWPLIRVPMWPSSPQPADTRLTYEQWKKQYEAASPVMR